ncbi:ATP-binding protein [Domibacillus iocasae]|nr:ATP-binding protein [Domibacillus iocasae]
MVPSAGLAKENVKCPKCQDKQVIIYRVHKDTEWNEVPGVKTLVPDSMVLEADFLDMKVCQPEEAWQWRETYSIRCECVERRKRERLMKSSDITDEFRKLRFQNFRIEGKHPIVVQAKQCALSYFSEFDNVRSLRENSISLLGQPGAGKTHLLTAVANNLIDRKGVSVQYFPYIEGTKELRDDFNLLTEKLERMKKADVLFIDDLFKPVKRVPRASDWQVEQMYDVLNYRYLNHLPIMVSSELTIHELVEVDEALATRISEMSKSFTVVIKGNRMELNHRLEGLKDV